MQDYITAGNAFLATLHAYGYDYISDVQVRVMLTSPEVVFHCYLQDEFQKSATWDQTVQIGYRSFEFENGRFVLPEGFKTREERELHFLAKRLGSSKEIADQMVSAAGRAFALRLKDELDQLRTMIAGPTNA